jgi:predicted GNAT family N-acyltransferase
MSDIHVRIADWQKDHAALRSIRETVFIAEQAVPPELEWDADDASAVHFLALAGDTRRHACCRTAISAVFRYSRTGAA